MTDFSKDEKRLLKLSVGIVSIQQSIKSGDIHGPTKFMMSQLLEKSTNEFNSLILKLDLNQLIKRLEA